MKKISEFLDSNHKTDPNYTKAEVGVMLMEASKQAVDYAYIAGHSDGWNRLPANTDLYIKYLNEIGSQWSKVEDVKKSQVKVFILFRWLNDFYYWMLNRWNAMVAYNRDNWKLLYLRKKIRKADSLHRYHGKQYHVMPGEKTDRLVIVDNSFIGTYNSRAKEFDAPQITYKDVLKQSLYSTPSESAFGRKV